MVDSDTADAVKQIREQVRQAADAAEAIGPVFRARHDAPDSGLDTDV
ncbi:hypothetical protein KGQ20_39785 [Catenulispora sp. NF23]|nr:hypothetical protein [Catenulispora pinistramenti]MBS2538906.1 hypothetical protein [Catenulispora pinistramenti]